MADVAAVRVDNVDDHPEIAGAFNYYGDRDRDIAGMTYTCPCGCGRRGALEFQPTADLGPSWAWDGNREKPTLSPNVRQIINGRMHWQGWLRAGVWVSG